ncbi:hypothetical protein [Anaeroglobus geminatus]|jgi:hypothetical protein|uniref:Uncharacterized protein n=1 Tax=Anaeroglobus geminatus F0357 TaxID=861450 RepID=G9YIG9_9FIRM|nr:hypothetical protein [Anaeroglobus geminatus]EHM39599.1 hypothetical protein HMPREF0080_01461 [Anaeroglobus geminatus F0357]
MKKSWFAVMGILSVLLLPGPMATAADDITVNGQFEGAYAENVYCFVTTDGQEIPAMMEHAGKIMSYTPFQATGHVAYNQAGQPVLIIRNVSYQERLPNQRTVSYRKDVGNPYPSQGSIASRTFRDAGYFMGPIKSDLSNWYQTNPGDLKIEDLGAYQVAWDLSGLPAGTRVCTVGSVLSSAGGGLMNFRTAQGNIILINLNGAVVPMGQRVTVLGIISTPPVLTVQFVNSVAP